MINFPNYDPRGRDLVQLVERLKYERWLSNETSAILDAAFNNALDVLLSSKYRDLTQFQKTRAQQLYRELTRIINDGYREIADLHVEQMKQLATLEAETTHEHVASILQASDVLGISFGPSLPKNYLASIAKLPIQGWDVGTWFATQAQKMTKETQRIIQLSLIEGKSSTQIASRIMASDKTQGPVLIRRARAEARTISRTIVNGVQNDAQIAQMETLPSRVSDRYVWESVLDARTTPICRALSGRVFRYDDPNRRTPPAHLNCRSSIRPILKGIDEPMASQSEPRTLKNYDTYLRRQTSAQQDAILGRTRADYWRSGKMSLADAIDGDNRVLNLKELRAKLEALAVAP